MKDKKIKLVGEIGTKNILENISKNCKIIFMSSVEVFNGKKKKYFEINI